MSNLVERLRCQDLDMVHTGTVQRYFTERIEAADELERLSAENESLRAALQIIQGLVKQLYDIRKL
jgi:hypothetical protein